MASNELDRLGSFELNRLDHRVLEGRDEIILVRGNKYLVVEKGSLYNISYLMNLLVNWIEIHFQGAEKLDIEKTRSIAQAKQLFNQARKSLQVGDKQELLTGVREYRKFAKTMQSAPELQEVHIKVVEYLTVIANRCSTPEEALFALALRQEAGDLLSDLPPIEVADADWKSTIEELSQAPDFKEKLLELANRELTPQDAVMAIALREIADFCIDPKELLEIDLKAVFETFVSGEIGELEFWKVKTMLSSIEAKEALFWTPDEVNRALKELAEEIRGRDSQEKISLALTNLRSISGLVDRVGNETVKGVWSRIGTERFKQLRELRSRLSRVIHEQKQVVESTALAQSHVVAEVDALRAQEKEQVLRVKYPTLPANEVKASQRQPSGWWSSLWGDEKKRPPSPLHMIADWAQLHGVVGFNLDQLRLISADLTMRAPQGLNAQQIFDGHTALRQRLVPGSNGLLTGKELLDLVNKVLSDVDRALGPPVDNEPRKRSLEAKIRELEESKQETAAARIKEYRIEIAKLDQPLFSPDQQRLIALKKWLEEAKKEALHIVEFTEKMTVIAAEVKSRQVKRSELHQDKEIAKAVVDSEKLINSLNSLESLLTLGRRAL